MYIYTDDMQRKSLLNQLWNGSLSLGEDEKKKRLERAKKNRRSATSSADDSNVEPQDIVAEIEIPTEQCDVDLAQSSVPSIVIMPQPDITIESAAPIAPEGFELLPEAASLLNLAKLVQLGGSAVLALW